MRKNRKEQNVTVLKRAEAGIQVAERNSGAIFFDSEGKESVERIRGASRRATGVARMPRWLHRVCGTSLVAHYNLGDRGAQVGGPF